MQSDIIRRSPEIMGREKRSSRFSEVGVIMIEKIKSKLQELPHGEYADDYGKGFSAGINAAIKIVQEVAKEYGNGWIPTEKELPPHSDELLLVQCNGKTRNVVFENAFCLASYTEEGWILEMYPELENPDVVAWQYLPSAPYQKGE